jgi:hypothetical protein
MGYLTCTIEPRVESLKISNTHFIPWAWLHALGILSVDEAAAGANHTHDRPAL